MSCHNALHARATASTHGAAVDWFKAHPIGRLDPAQRMASRWAALQHRVDHHDLDIAACMVARAVSTGTRPPVRRLRSGHESCICLRKRGVRTIYTFGDCIMRDTAQRLAQWLNTNDLTLDLDSPANQRYLWRLRCGRPNLENFTSDIRCERQGCKPSWRLLDAFWGG